MKDKMDYDHFARTWLRSLCIYKQCRSLCLSLLPGVVLKMRRKSTFIFSEPTIKTYRRTLQSRKTIPKIIHQIWSGDIIPEEFVRHVRSITKYNPHPEWEYYFWTLDLGREFIIRKFPKLVKIYDHASEYFSLWWHIVRNISHCPNKKKPIKPNLPFL